MNILETCGLKRDHHVLVLKWIFKVSKICLIYCFMFASFKKLQKQETRNTVQDVAQKWIRIKPIAF